MERVLTGCEAEQIELFDSSPAECCQNCHWWATLVKPWVRDDGSAIYGYCFAGGSKDYSVNMGKGLPVFYAPTSGVPCQNFKKRRRANA